MSYQLLIMRRAQKQLAQLPPRDYERIRDALAALAQDARPPGCRKLVGRDGWRVRVGDYRVIYEVNDKQRVVTVLQVGHRRDIYT